MPTLTQLLTPTVWLLLVLSSLSSLLFVQTYCSSVCHFIDGLKPNDLLINLGLIFLFHLVARFILNRIFSKPWSAYSLPRQAYYLSIASWFLAGIAALVLHAFKYPDFPTGSHFKLLSGYWILGGGILAQLEYVIFEYQYKQLASANTVPHFKERLSRRILESLFIFTLAPTLTMLLTVLRYSHEGVLSQKVSNELLFIGLLTILGAIIVAFFIGRMLKEDTRLIVDAVKEIAQGNLQTSIIINRSDELGEISEGINAMTKGLQLREKIKEAFGRFVNPHVASMFIEQFVEDDKSIKMGGQKQHAVVLMADLRDFTVLSETMPPDELIALLNEYFSVMVDVIQTHGGIIDKFMGDAIMAVFGLPKSEQPEKDAANAALEMRRELHKLNQSLRSRALPTLNNGIGIHSGEVIAGYLGSEKRLEFTVIGSTVNIASRIEEQTKAVDQAILISDAVKQRLGDSFNAAFIDELSLKGVSQSVKVYTLS